MGSDMMIDERETKYTMEKGAEPERLQLELYTLSLVLFCSDETEVPVTHATCFWKLVQRYGDAGAVAAACCWHVGWRGKRRWFHSIM